MIPALGPSTLLDMEIRHLSSLIAIADHGSFSGAARALGTVQSNVSAHISRLEKDLGVVLVERNGGALSDEGVVVVERARRIIHELQDIEADVHSSDTEIEGETRLGSIGTTGRWLMPRLLPALKKAHPLVRAIIHEGGTSSLIPRVLNGELDAAIVHFPVDDHMAGLDLAHDAGFFADHDKADRSGGDHVAPHFAIDAQAAFEAQIASKNHVRAHQALDRQQPLCIFFREHAIKTPSKFDGGLRANSACFQNSHFNAL